LGGLRSTLETFSISNTGGGSCHTFEYCTPKTCTSTFTDPRRPPRICRETPWTVASRFSLTRRPTRLTRLNRSRAGRLGRGSRPNDMPFFDTTFSSRSQLSIRNLQRATLARPKRQSGRSDQSRLRRSVSQPVRHFGTLFTIIPFPKAAWRRRNRRSRELPAPV
jgi:hypothetical protein